MADEYYALPVRQEWDRLAAQHPGDQLEVWVPLHEPDDDDEREFRRQVLALPFVAYVHRMKRPDGFRPPWFRVTCKAYAKVMTDG